MSCTAVPLVALIIAAGAFTQVPPLRAGPPTLAWGNKVPPAFREKVRKIAADLGTDPNYLMAVMAFETGETFRQSRKNRATGAVGLIQFLPSTARNLGTSPAALKKMSPEEQLGYVARYLAPT